MPKLSIDLQRDLQTGLAHHRAGRLPEAEALYRKVLQQRPSQPDALNLLGVIMQERGSPTRAVELISQAVHARPQFPEALTNLARAQRAAGDPNGAAASARRAIALAANLAEAHCQLGRALLDLNDNEGAAAACRAAIALTPTSLDALVNLAAALTRQENYTAAAQTYQLAHALQPHRPETLTDWGSVLTEMEQYEDALRCHQRATSLAPNDPRTHAGYALTLKEGQDIGASVEACQRALALDPDYLPVWLLLAGNLSALGRFPEAVSCYRRALELDPDSAEARRGMVAAGEQIDDVAELTRLHATVANPALPVYERAAAGFALGTLLDRAGDYDAAFGQFEAANRLARAAREAEGKGFDGRTLHEQVSLQIALFTKEAFASTRDWGDPSELPVYIVGMPRSGTTLTEQIAASHPDVFGAGERKDIGRIARLLGNDIATGPTAWGKDAVYQEASAHLARLRMLAGGARLVIDKMPDNIFWLGVIAVLFPNARLVLCRRDLRDVCLSCFFQSFHAGLPWTNDLADCATRAVEVERLVKHWRSVLPLRILELQYESLVADPEGESRRLVDFLGLPWDPACLAFHTTQRQVITASLWQVRQPLYSTSVGRWRNYRRHLAPLLQGLGGLVPADAPG